MTKTFSTLHVLVALLILAFACYGQDPPKPQPVGKEHRETLLKGILKVQAAQLQFFRTRDQAQAAVAQSENESKQANEALNALLEQARKADKVAADCNPNIDLTWSCPAKPPEAKEGPPKK